MAINNTSNSVNVNATSGISATDSSTGVQQSGKPNTGVDAQVKKATNWSMNQVSRGNRNIENANGGGVAPMTPEQMAAQLQSPQARISSAIESCKTIAGNPGTPPEARIVYERMSLILEKTLDGCNGDFSSKNIGRELDCVLEGMGDLDYGYATVGKFNGELDDKDGKSVTGKMSTWDKEIHTDSIRVCRNLEISGKGVRVPNPCNTYEKIETKDEKGEDVIIKKFEESIVSKESSINGTTLKLSSGFTVRCDSGITPEQIYKQLNSDADTFSGDIHVHKLEPGTVLVRVFGQRQSPLRPCWCRADDSTSSVTCAKDLLEKLAVRPDWNGDGNMAVMIVPNDVDVMVAEGKIGTQICTYRTGVGGQEEVVQGETFTFSGGGTQLNILAKDQPDGKPPFAGDSDGVLKNNCMFCFRDTDMACVRNHLSQGQEQ